MEKLERMYRYLNEHGELYFIEHMENGQFMPIGDVTFWQYDMPIVIGSQSYRGKGIGKCVIGSLIERGKELGYSALYVNEIYKYNIASQRTFESMGFIRYEETANGYRYCLNLSK
jgi:RimJ/RimL family protein N-acetyltransferase